MSKYDSYAPSADKFINSDGSVVELVNGTIVEPANPTRAELYKTYQPKANKFLKSDGSIVELDSIGGGGTIEIPLKGSGTTAEMNAVTDAVDGDFWLNTDTSTIWKYTAGTWNDTGVGLGVDLSMYQIPKLTSNTGYKRKDITNDTELLEAYGSVSINAGYMNTLAQANGVQYDTDADGQALGFVNRSNDNPGLLTTVVQTTKTHRSFALTVWTTIGSVKIKELGNNLGTVVGSDAGIIELYGKSGIFTVSGNYPIVEGVMFGAVSGTITMPDDVTNKSVVTITDITGKSAVTSFGGTDTEIIWTKVGGSTTIPTLQAIADNAPLSVETYDGGSTARGIDITCEGFSAVTEPTAVDKYDYGTFSVDSDKVSFYASGTEYNIDGDVVKNASTTIVIDDDMVDLKRSGDNKNLSERLDTELINKSEVEELLPYALIANDGKNLTEITSDAVLFASPVGRYNKGTYSIGGDASSGMIEVYDYGNNSGYKKANAYFSNEIWTATFKATGFSGDGWKKIAEEIKPYFENVTVTTPITLSATPSVLTEIITDEPIKARAYLSGLVTRSGGSAAIGIVTINISDGSNSYSADYDIARDLASTVNLNSAKRISLQAGTVSISASYAGTGTVTINNIAASLE